MIGAPSLVALSGAGNRFLLLDGLRGGAAEALASPQAAADLAREACAGARAELGGRRADGLLIATRTDGRLSMVVHNADGSRAQACGNGLRCLATWAAARGHLPAGESSVATEAGPRRVRIAPGSPPRVEVELGVPWLVARRELACAGRALLVHEVDVGNPHAVVLAAALDALPLDELAAAVAAGRPAGVNVELVVPTPGGARMRVHERGVGETESCGTGAVAAALVLELAGGHRGPLLVECRGGLLEVERDAQGSAWLGGPVELAGEGAS